VQWKRLRCSGSHRCLEPEFDVNIREEQVQMHQAIGFLCCQLELEPEEPVFNGIYGFRYPASMVHRTGGSELCFMRFSSYKHQR